MSLNLSNIHQRLFLCALNLNQWESLRFSGKLLNFSLYSTTGNISWNFDWNTVNFHWISETVKFRVCKICGNSFNFPLFLAPKLNTAFERKFPNSPKFRYFVQILFLSQKSIISAIRWSFLIRKLVMQRFKVRLSVSRRRGQDAVQPFYLSAASPETDYVRPSGADSPSDVGTTSERRRGNQLCETSQS